MVKQKPIKMLNRQANSFYRFAARKNQKNLTLKIKKKPEKNIPALQQSRTVLGTVLSEIVAHPP